MSSPAATSRSAAIFKQDLSNVVSRTDRMFLWLLIGQWLFGVAIAATYSPRTWIGEYWSIHAHLIAATVLGALFASYPLYCIIRFPQTRLTRHVVAIGQMLQSALLVHVTGGRIETHFHVFGSLALLAFYRDWWVLLTGSAVVLLDHIALGLWFPLSVYGVVEASIWRSFEHAFWVVFEVVFLAISCRTGIRELRLIAERQSEVETIAADLRQTNGELQAVSKDLERANEVLELRVQERTEHLTQENEERRQAEERLSRQTRLLHLIIDGIAEGVAVADTQGKLTLVNSAAERIGGGLAQGAPGTEWPDRFGLFYPDQVTRFPADELPLMRACRGESGPEVEVYLRAPGWEEGVFLICAAQPLRDDQGTLLGGVSIFRDYTLRRRLEEKAREAQKIDAVGRLAGGIAHDFNNLMTVVVGYAELLQSQVGPNSSAQTMLGEIKRSGEQAAALTRQLLAFSRKQQMQRSALDLNEVLRGLEMTIYRLAGRTVQVALELKSALDRIEADVGQIEQLLVNLVMNARDAMPNGGKLTILTENVELDESYSQLQPDLKLGPYVAINIADTGCGMDADSLAHLFEPFYTTKGLGKGSGLGLATVHGIVKQSNGYIWVQSTLGEGTSFKICFPRYLERSATESRSGSDQDCPPSEDCRGPTIENAGQNSIPA